MSLQILDIRCVCLKDRPSYIYNLHYTDLVVSDNSTFSLTLSWTPFNNPIDPIDHCNVYATCLLGREKEGVSWEGECVYLGTAYANCYRVCSMHILSRDLEEQPFGLKLVVQTVTKSRRKPSVHNADTLVVCFKP